MANDDDDLLTSAARTIGTAIGKVSTTLHIAEAPPPAPAVKRPAKKKTVVKKTAAKKATTKRRK